jgi:hypothetical protein
VSSLQAVASANPCFPTATHFSFECPDNINPRAHAGEVEDPDDMLENQLYRTESGNLTSYSFQHPHTSHVTTLYHDEDDLYEDPESGNGQGGW